MRSFSGWLVLVVLCPVLLAVTADGSGAATPPADASPAQLPAAVPGEVPGEVLRVGTYNVLGSVFPVLQRRHGGPAPTRARRLARVVLGATGESGTPRAMDVVGLQEVQPDQFRLLRDLLAGYRSFPGRPGSQRPILWRTDRFTLQAAGWVHYPGYDDRGLRPGDRAPWVRLLERSTGTTLTVANVHAVAWNDRSGSDRGGAQKRERTAERLRSWALRRIAAGERVVVLGDFNSTFSPRYRGRVGVLKDEALDGDRDRLPYCVLTRGGQLTNAWDPAHAVLPAAGGCPTRRRDLLRLVDAVYVGRGLAVTGWHSPDTWLTRHASDHRPTYADLEVTP